MHLPIFLKFSLVASLLAAGAYFLLKGLGVDIPIFEYKGAKAYDIPAGVALLVVGIALARVWKIRTSQTVATQTTTRAKDGRSKTTNLETKSEIRFMPRTK